jgi:DNA-binding XRE family transcriptional regulator
MNDKQQRDALLSRRGARLLTRSREAEVFGFHLRELRTERGLTQRQLADRCRSNVPSISNLARGLTAPSLAMPLRLIEALECRVVDFVEVFDRGPWISPKSRKD